MLYRQTDEVVESLLGDPYSPPPGGELARTVTFVRALPAAVPVLPDPALEAEIIPALANAARSSELEATRQATVTTPAARPSTPSRWRLRVAVLAGAVLLLPVLMAGLAYAGVELPEPVDDAFESVGVDLPNQAGDAGVAAGAYDDDSEKGRKKASQNTAAGTANTGDGPGASGDQGSDGNASQGKPGKGKPDHAGQEATPPGQGGTAPGQGGEIPGTGAETPDPEPATPPVDPGPPTTPPGQGGTPPGQGGVPPGQGGVPPGQGG
jgi:hypothetical protein